MSKLRILLSVAVIGILLTIASIIHIQSTLTKKPLLKLATTTSAYDSGLLDAIVPVFESKYDVEVRIIPVGSGQAFEIAKRGDADVILVHSREMELDFINSGYGIHRVGLMYNDFLIVGPSDDPAVIGGLSSAAEAFRKIAEGGFIFISRADKSGTHNLELSIWRSINLFPSSSNSSWYIEANRGMGSVLRMANEMKAYTLVDRATWLSFKDQLNSLKVLVEGDPLLINPYSLILVNPEKNPHVNFIGAITLVKFLISEEGQRLIENFKKGEETLFKPLIKNVTLALNLGFSKQIEEINWYMGQEGYSEVAEPNYFHRTFNEEIINITILSLKVSLSAVLLGALIGLPLGVILGLKHFRAKRVIVRLIEIALKTFVNTLMGFPPVVAGLIVYLLLNRSGPLGFLGLLYTPTAMIITQLILVTPIITGITMSSISSIERDIRERSLSLGATERQAAWMIIRESRNGILTAIIVAFGAAISEVGGIMIAGGNIRWVTRTLTTAIVTEIELGNFMTAITLGMILLSISFLINLALTIMQLKSGRAGE